MGLPTELLLLLRQRQPLPGTVLLTQGQLEKIPAHDSGSQCGACTSWVDTLGLKALSG